MIQKKLIPLFLAAALFAGPRTLSAEPGDVPAPAVRVALFEGSKPVRLSIEADYRVMSFQEGRTLADSRVLKDVSIKAHQDRLMVAGVVFPKDIWIQSDGPAPVLINGRPYRGRISAHRTGEGGLLIVNHIDLEEYLYGVLYHEVADWWPMEALKAQAVAARGYALYQMRERKRALFDVFNNQSSQMYGGQFGERERTNEAVDQTRGQALVFQGQVLPAFYHATCGGITRDASELWKVDLEPLKGGVRCGFCWFSPHFSWKFKISEEDFKERLRLKDKNIGVIDTIRIGALSPSERALEIVVDHSLGHEAMSAKNLRQWIGPELIRSESFEISFKPGRDIVFKGQGWGHGVGMCQWGALGMSIMRKNAGDILSFYYPGAEISKIY